VVKAFGRWKNLEELRRNREQSAETSARERELLAEEIREIEGLGFAPESWREQQDEHRRLAHARELTDAAEAGVTALSDAQISVEGLLEGLLPPLRDAASLDPKLGDALRAADSALIESQEAARELRHYLQGLDLDPARLDELDRRLRDVHGLARKLRIEPDDLPQALASRGERLQALGGEDSLEALKRQEGEAGEAYRALGRKLSAERREAARRLAPEVTETMQALAMKGGAFSVSLEPLAVPGPHGLEAVEFLVTANAGQPAGALAKVASGGELSRVSLAIQVLMSGSASVSTLIFDEVDAGIGGGVAEIVGRLLSRLGNEHQVLCVTHLPQVAAWARHQFRVAKHDTPRGAAAEVEPLDADERVEEIARMLGGVKITEATRRHAAEMLGAAATGRAGARGRSRTGAR
jgi:DNA repair protein RecN (Recombination protein N)